jgi:hypothetical protein
VVAVAEGLPKVKAMLQEAARSVAALKQPAALKDVREVGEEGAGAEG